MNPTLYKPSIIIVMVISTISVQWVASGLINWKSIYCENFDEKVVVIDYCYIKPIRRDVSAINVHIILKRRPVERFSVNINFQKRASGWKPFLYNFTVDGCKFLKSDRRYAVANFFYRFSGLASHSNLNHTCPFYEDIYFSNHTFPDTSDVSKTLPLPSGQYGFFSTWLVDAIPRFKIDAVIEIVE